MRSQRNFVLFAAVCLLVSGGCGGSMVDVNEAFREIQVHEATIAHTAPEAASCEEGRPCGARDRICEAAEAICGIAGSLDDSDADARCELARRQCSEPPRSENPRSENPRSENPRSENPENE